MRQIAVVVVFCMAAAAILAPFCIAVSLIGTEARGQSPAGQFVAGTLIRQEGRIPLLVNASGSSLCFGIQFATYARSNNGNLKINWQQGGNRDHWTLPAPDLKDNAFRYFCPGQGIKPESKFVISVEDSGSTPGHAPTAWLTSDTRFGTVSINGNDQKTSLSLSFAASHKITMGQLVQIDRGAYLFGWAMSVIIGLASLVLAEKKTAAVT